MAVNLQADPRFPVYKNQLETHLRQWNPNLVKSLEKKQAFQSFLNTRVENLLSQLVWAEFHNQQIDQEEAEQEMYPEAEKTPEESELEKLPQ